MIALVITVFLLLGFIGYQHLRLHSLQRVERAIQGWKDQGDIVLLVYVKDWKITETIALNPHGEESVFELMNTASELLIDKQYPTASRPIQVKMKTEPSEHIAILSVIRNAKGFENREAAEADKKLTEEKP